MKKRKVAIVLVLILGVGTSFSMALAKTADSSNKTFHTDALINATHLEANIDSNADLDPKTPGYLEEDNMCFNTTNAAPNFDPLSSFDAELLDVLRDAPPETRIDYDPITGTVTIPDQDALPSEIITETPAYAPDGSAAEPTAPVDSPEVFADTDDRCLDTISIDPDFGPLVSFDGENLE